MDTFYDRAYSLISSQKAREAFNIDAEPEAIRDEYGRNEAGQRMLMARRLVAAGVRFVTLTYGGWDMHNNITGRHAGPDARLRPGLRRADPRPGSHRPARTRRWSWSPANSAARRRSTAPPAATTGPRCSAWCWPAAASSGARSTARRTPRPRSPKRTRSDPADLATTIYHQLGIVADKELMAPGDRPIEIVDGGKVRKELLV